MIHFFGNESTTVFAVQTKKKSNADEMSAETISKLNWLFANAHKIEKSVLADFFVGPRAAMITPWSTNAVEITQNMGISGIIRIEEFEKVEGSFTSEEQYWACRAGFIEGYEAAKEKYETKQQEHEDILCNCSQGKGIDFDEMGVEYCVSCQKQIN